jgi:plasmid stability protein
MGTLTVRNLPEETLAKLRVRAAGHGRSMEAEVRQAIIALADVDELTGSVEEEAIRRREDIRRRVDSIHSDLRARLGGELPKGRVDAFIAERKAAAERGE